MIKKPARKRRNRDELKHEIVVAATELFAREGYTAPSIREIAAHAQVALPALYRFFINKRDLYVQCCRYALQNDVALLNAICTLDVMDPAKPELVIYATTLAMFSRRSAHDFPDIVSRAIFDGDAHMIHDEAEALFGSAYYRTTLQAAGRLSDPQQAVRKLALVHSLTFAFPPILSFWQPFQPVQSAPDTEVSMTIEVLKTVFPKGDWDSAAREIAALGASIPTQRAQRLSTPAVDEK